MKAIESVEFIGRLGAVSTFYAFDRALARMPETAGLFLAMRDPSVGAQVRARAIDLAQLGLKNQEAAHWLDLPLAAYLRLLDVVGAAPSDALNAEELKRAGMWWASRMTMRTRSGEIAGDSANRMAVNPGPEPRTEVVDVRSGSSSLTRILAHTAGPKEEPKLGRVASGIRRKPIVVFATGHRVDTSSFAGGAN